MHTNMIRATALRVFRQLQHDPRTLGLLFIVPCILLGILAWMYNDTPGMFNHIGPSLLGIIPFVMMFLVTSITTLRERSSGTLERLLTMPIAKLDILGGYAITFGIMAVIQAVIVSFVSVHVYGLEVAGSELLLVTVALADALLGAMLGLFVSAFAGTEFQVVQFLPALILPQFLLCGLLVPLDQLPDLLRFLAHCLPLTYAVEAMQRIASEAATSAIIYRDIGIVAGFAVCAVVLGAITLKRQTS